MEVNQSSRQMTHTQPQRCRQLNKSSCEQLSCVENPHVHSLTDYGSIHSQAQSSKCPNMDFNHFPWIHPLLSVLLPCNHPLPFSACHT